MRACAAAQRARASRASDRPALGFATAGFRLTRLAARAAAGRRARREPERLAGHLFDPCSPSTSVHPAHGAAMPLATSGHPVFQVSARAARAGFRRAAPQRVRRSGAAARRARAWHAGSRRPQAPSGASGLARALPSLTLCAPALRSFRRSCRLLAATVVQNGLTTPMPLAMLRHELRSLLHPAESLQPRAAVHRPRAEWPSCRLVHRVDCCELRRAPGKVRACTAALRRCSSALRLLRAALHCCPAADPLRFARFAVYLLCCSETARGETRLSSASFGLCAGGSPQ